MKKQKFNVFRSFFKFLDKIKWLGLRKIYWTFRHFITWIIEVPINTGLIYPSYQQLLLKRFISQKLINTYHGDKGHNINFTQCFLGFGLIHYAFIRNIKPKKILCVGSTKGFIPAIMAIACKDNGMGHVDFVDAGYDQTQPKKNWGGIGFWKKKAAYKHFEKMNLSPYVNTHIMTTKEYVKRYPKKRYQYIYIDGDHSYKGVKLDFDLFWPLLDHNCFMSFHDVVARGYLDKGLFGVWKLWKEISQKHAIIFPFPKNSGLGIVQKS